MKLERVQFEELAQNDSTPGPVLEEIWYATRSPKIRKMIASHPNCSECLMIEASRLYLEEVLDNPSFALSSLFGDNENLIRVQEVYRDPSKITQTAYYFLKRNTINEILFRAALISKNLDFKILNYCIGEGPKSSFERAIKNPLALENIRAIIDKYIESKDSNRNTKDGSIINLYSFDIIDSEKMTQILRKYPCSSLSARKGVYHSFYNYMDKKYLSSGEREKKAIAKMFAHLIFVSKSHILSWINSFYYNSLPFPKGKESEDRLKMLIAFFNASKDLHLEIKKSKKKVVVDSMSKKVNTLLRKTLEHICDEYSSSLNSYNSTITSKELEKIAQVIVTSEIIEYKKTEKSSSSVFWYCKASNLVKALSQCSKETREILLDSGMKGI